MGQTQWAKLSGPTNQWAQLNPQNILSDMHEILKKIWIFASTENWEIFTHTQKQISIFSDIFLEYQKIWKNQAEGK